MQYDLDKLFEYDNAKGTEEIKQEPMLDLAPAAPFNIRYFNLKRSSLSCKKWAFNKIFQSKIFQSKIFQSKNIFTWLQKMAI